MSKKEKILHYFKTALNNGINNAVLVSGSRKDQHIHSVPRMIILLDGQHQIEYFSLEEGIKKIIKGPGSAQYSGENGYLFHKYLAPGQAISLDYYGKFIRCIYIDYDGKNLPPTQRDIFYHTGSPLSEAGQSLLKVLDKIAENEHYQEAALELLTALLRISIEDIIISEEWDMPAFSPARALWNKLDTYLKLHFKENLSRDSVARSFRISTSHVSHLFNKFGNESFSSTLNRYRLQHATLLLKQTRLSLDEIAEQCNYKYTSYFVRSFRQRYKMTPSAFRFSKDSVIISDLDEDMHELIVSKKPSGEIGE